MYTYSRWKIVTRFAYCLLFVVLDLVKSENWTYIDDELLHDERIVIVVAGFFPKDTELPQGKIGRGVIPAVDLAVEDINRNPNILKGYKLQVYKNDSKCSAAVGTKALFDNLFYPPKKVILFGDACTEVTAPIAQATPFFNLTLLSYADTHPMFSEKKDGQRTYPNFFRTVPSESEFNPARIKLLRYFNWTTVGTLFQDNARYSLPHQELVPQLEKANINQTIEQSFRETAAASIEKLAESDVRIIIGIFNESWARRVFCEVHHRKLFGERYQWIILGTYEGRWWEKREKEQTCTQEELLKALQGYISTDIMTLNPNKDQLTVSTKTPAEYDMEYSNKRKAYGIHIYSKLHGYAYDGVWTIALAIDKINQRLQSKHRNLTMQDFSYSDDMWAKLFRDSLNATHFTGVTGEVSFKWGDRLGHILLRQFQGDREVEIGAYDALNDVLNMDYKSTVWPGGAPPLPKTIIIHKHMYTNKTLFWVMTVLCSLGIIMAGFFLTINIKFRNQRYIKMSSPQLNNVIVVGCMLTYVSVFLLGVDTSIVPVARYTHLCTARSWIMSLGFTLAFGAMFSKTWRVHAIFTNIKLNKKVIKDYKLFLIVGVLLFCDLVILITWMFVDPIHRAEQQLPPKKDSRHADTEIIPVIEFCDSLHMNIWLGVIMAFKGLLMAFGCFLAWETRHVSIPALNDSKYIGMSVYNVVILCVAGAAIAFILKDQQDASFCIIGLFVIFCTTITLALVFVPKVIELKRNPEGDDKRIRATLKPSKKDVRSSHNTDLHYKLKLLKEENIKFRKSLDEKNKQFEILIAKLRADGADVSFTSPVHKTVAALRQKESPAHLSSKGSLTDEEEVNSAFSSEDRSDGISWHKENAAPSNNKNYRLDSSSGVQSEIATTEAIEMSDIDRVKFNVLPTIASSETNIQSATSDNFKKKNGQKYFNNDAHVTGHSQGPVTYHSKKKGKFADLDNSSLRSGSLQDSQASAVKSPAKAGLDSISSDSSTVIHSSPFCSEASYTTVTNAGDVLPKSKLVTTPQTDSPTDQEISRTNGVLHNSVIVDNINDNKDLLISPIETLTAEQAEEDEELNPSPEEQCLISKKRIPSESPERLLGCRDRNHQSPRSPRARGRSRDRRKSSSAAREMESLLRSRGRSSSTSATTEHDRLDEIEKQISNSISTPNTSLDRISSARKRSKVKCDIVEYI